jgi:uncharacterized membrane protein
MTSARGRIDSIDLLRGLVVVMVLDHVRDFFTSVRFDPLDLTQTVPALIFTRWITHYCAPSFILLSGVSARLVAARKSTNELSRFLLTRGIWLVFLEVTLVTFLWMFNLRYQLGVVLQVIWAIGISMMALSLLVYLPVRIVGMFGVIMIATHNLLDGITPARFGRYATVWNLLHVQGATYHAFVQYPVIPWIGVMAAGYWMGGIYSLPLSERRRRLIFLGTALTAGFVVLRLTNLYGDPQPWVHQRSMMFTVMSFLNTTKYPPSLCYLLMTVGPSALALAWLENVRGSVARIFVTYGRVPFFFYVLHLAAVHLLAGVVGIAKGFGAQTLGNVFLFYPPEWGFRLRVVYLVWITIVAGLYPACAWFASVKQRRSDRWLSYL